MLVLVLGVATFLVWRAVRRRRRAAAALAAPPDRPTVLLAAAGRAANAYRLPGRGMRKGF